MYAKLQPEGIVYKWLQLSTSEVFIVMLSKSQNPKMPGLVCQFCDKKFAQRSSRSRHERTMHIQMISDDESEDDASSVESENEERQICWRMIIDRARKLLNERITANDALREPHLSRIVEVIGRLIQTHLALSNYMENRDCIYGSAAVRVEKYTAEGMTKSDASDQAWHDMRLEIRELIDENIDLFDENA